MKSWLILDIEKDKGDFKAGQDILAGLARPLKRSAFIPAFQFPAEGGEK